jgi:hypothetical protein
MHFKYSCGSIKSVQLLLLFFIWTILVILIATIYVFKVLIV